MNSKTSRLVRVFVIALVLFLAAGCSSKEEKKAKHMANAQKYSQNGEYKKALIELKNAVQLDPKDDAAYYALGEVHMRLKEGREGFQAFSRAAAINPNNLKAQLRVGQILLLGRNAEEARKKAELILEKSPENVDALGLLSSIQVLEKNIDGAIQTLEKSVSLDPDNFNIQLSMARLFLMKGDLKKAQKAYQEAIVLNPASNVSYVELSRIYATWGQWEKAEAELKKMIDTAGSNYLNLHILARFYESRGDWEKAEETYVKAADTSPEENVVPWMVLGEYYARRRDYDNALGAMQKALSIKKDDPDIRVAIAQLQLDFGKVEDAEPTVKKVLEGNERHVGANFLMGRVYLSQKNFTGAIERFDLVIRERPRSANAYYFKALALLGNKDPKLAQSDLVKALELNPRLLDARLILAEFYLRQRDEKLAGEQIEKALAQAPRNLRALTLQGSLKVVAQDVAGAEETFKKIIELYPKYAPAYARLGLLYNLTKRTDAALDSFQKALEIDPRQNDALAMIVGVHVRDKEYDKALAVCDKYKDLAGDDAGRAALVEYLKGVIYVSRDDLKEAEARFKKSIEADPDRLTVYLALARIYIREQRIDEAVDQYTHLLEKNPNYLAGYMALGTLYEHKGDVEKAETHYRKALELKRDFGPAANNLAWILADRGDSLDEALGLAQTAKEQMPDSAPVMDTMGWIYYLKGSYLNAISELQDSLSRNPDNPVINYHMGMALYKNKQPEKAREYLEKALTLDGNFKGSAEAKAVLKEIDAVGKS